MVAVQVQQGQPVGSMLAEVVAEQEALKQVESLCNALARS